MKCLIKVVKNTNEYIQNIWWQKDLVFSYIQGHRKKAAMFSVIEILNYQDNKHSLYKNSLWTLLDIVLSFISRQISYIYVSIFFVNTISFSCYMYVIVSEYILSITFSVLSWYFAWQLELIYWQFYFDVLDLIINTESFFLLLVFYLMIIWPPIYLMKLENFIFYMYMSHCGKKRMCQALNNSNEFEECILCIFNIIKSAHYLKKVMIDQKRFHLKS